MKKVKISILLNDKRCNMGCAYCYAYKNKAHCDEPIDLSKLDFIYERAIEKAEDEGEPFEIETVFWGGEPFFNPHLKDVVQYLREKFQTTFFTVSNGSLLNDEWADFCIENKFRVHISNDLAFQEKQRGAQYLDNPETSYAIAKMANAGFMELFQSVYSRECFDVMANYQYMLDWAERYDVTADLAMGFLFIKDYDGSNADLMFRENDERTINFQNSMCLFAKYSVEHPEKKACDSFVRKNLLGAYYGLTAERTDDGTGERKQVHCQTFDNGCFDLYGNEWRCPHDFESSDKPVTREVPGHSDLSDECKTCTYFTECNGICLTAGKQAQKLSCESLKICFRTLRQFIYYNSTEEERNGFLRESVADL